MTKILKKGINNLIGIPLLTAGHQLAGGLPAGASRHIVRAGLDIQAVNIAAQNIDFPKKKKGRKK
jgi:hypothetical protein